MNHPAYQKTHQALNNAVVLFKATTGGHYAIDV